MATYHLSLKNGTKGKGGPHALYIMRLGKFAKGAKGQQVIASEEFNLPYWAKSSYDFFRAADIYERANGRSYSEFEIALPNEISLKENIILVREFIKRAIGEQFVTAYAIHDTMASLHETINQPHAHIMFSVRTMTDPPDKAKPAHLFFKRFNKKHPEKGGYEKDTRYSAKAESNKNLKLARKLWEELVNNAYISKGIDKRISCKSLLEQKREALENNDYITAEFFDRPKPIRLNLRQLNITRKRILSFVESSASTDLSGKQNELDKIFNLSKRSSLFLQQRLMLEKQKVKLLELRELSKGSNFRELLILQNTLEAIASRLTKQNSYITFYNNSAFTNPRQFENAALDILTHGRTKEMRKLKDMLDLKYKDYLKLKKYQEPTDAQKADIQNLVSEMKTIQLEGNNLKAISQNLIKSLKSEDVEAMVKKLYTRQLKRLANAERLENTNSLILEIQDKIISTITKLKAEPSYNVPTGLVQNIADAAKKLNELPTLDFITSGALINSINEALDITLEKAKEFSDTSNKKRSTEQEKEF